MSPFKTLLQREWLQHRKGWFWLLGMPVALAIGAPLLPGTVELDGTPPTPVALFGITVVMVTAIVFMIAWLAMLFQAPGLARRDYQDRSVEFWMSLPVSHSASVAAPLVMHLLMLPLAGAVVGFLAGPVVAALVVSRIDGAGALASLPWATLLAGGLAALARLLLGVVLATLWLSPVVLVLMTASAWLKRWGVPAVIGVFGVGGAVLQKVYGITVVGETLARIGHQAARALVDASRDGGAVKWDEHTDVLAAIHDLPRESLHDAGLAIANLADPLFLGVLAVSAACFAALVLRRKHAGA